MKKRKTSSEQESVDAAVTLTHKVTHLDARNPAKWREGEQKRLESGAGREDAGAAGGSRRH